MSPRDSASAYHQTAAFGASPVGQVVALYDTILRDLHHALSAIDTGEIEKRCNAINHALTVIGELQGVLDFARGGEAARRLNSFYNVSRAMVTEAGVSSSREGLKELLAMYTRVRAAWWQVERTAAPSDSAQEYRITSKSQAEVRQDVSAPLEQPPSSGNSGWSA